MADEQTPPNPSDAPADPPAPTPAGDAARPDDLAEVIEKSEKAAETLAQDVKKGPVPPDLTEKANDMLAAARAAIAAAQTHQASGGGPLPTPQPDIAAATAVASEHGTPVSLPDFGAPMATAPAGGRDIDLLADVNLNVNIELGRTRMLVEDVLRLGEGSVVELDKLAGDPVDVFVNGRHVARGEVLVVNDNFCVRISEILSRVPGADD